MLPRFNGRQPVIGLWLFLLLLNLVGFILAACGNPDSKPGPMSPTDVENTVQAEVQKQLAHILTPTPTPDVKATVEARLTDFPSWTPTPTPEDELSRTTEDVGEWISQAANSVWQFIVGLWDSVKQYGTLAVILCCVLPIIALILLFIVILND